MSTKAKRFINPISPTGDNPVVPSMPPPAPSAPSAPPSPPLAFDDVLSQAGIRPWCRGLLLLFAHPHHLKLEHIMDAVTAAAESGGLTPQETALLAEVRAGEIAKECQAVRRIVT